MIICFNSWLLLFIITFLIYIMTYWLYLYFKY